MEQVNGENGDEAPVVSPGDIIRITGLPENAANAKQALLDLVPTIIEVSLFILIKILLIFLRKILIKNFFFYRLRFHSIFIVQLLDKKERTSEN